MRRINYWQVQNDEEYRESDPRYQAVQMNSGCNPKVKVIWMLTIVLICGLIVAYSCNQSFKKFKVVANTLLEQLEDQGRQIQVPPSSDTSQINPEQQLIISEPLEAEQLKQPQQQQEEQPISSIVDFVIPQNVWVYIDSTKPLTNLEQRSMENIKHFALKSNFTVNIIRPQNAYKWLSEETLKNINKLIQQVAKQLGNNNQQRIDIVKRHLISFWVLHENGGVLMEKNVLLTEDFVWLRGINASPYVNRGRKDSRAQYFAYFDINLGSPVAKANKPHARADYERYMIKSPGLETFFMAAVAKGEFLGRLLEELHKILESPDYLAACRNTFDLKVGEADRKDPYEFGVLLASHIVIHERQLELERVFPDQSRVDRFAIDEYGLFTINSRYFPRKIRQVFENMFFDKIYRNLALYSLEELEQTAGPQRYVVLLPLDRQIGDKLQRTIERSDKQLIHPSSFLAKYLLLDSPDFSYVLQKEVEKPTTNLSAPTWSALPKIVWLFWYTGLKRASIGNAVCIENLRRRAEESGFEVREVNNSNIEHYIGKELNERFDRAIKNHKIPVYAQTKSNFVRKAIIAKHGGVYMDVSYVALESFDWILNIAKYPSQFVFNRFGELPKVLMFFHPHFGQPFRWDFDARANTKSMELTAYENNFIIAEPGQALFNEWIDEYELTITSPYADTKARMEKYGVKGDSWTNDNELYLTSMDSLKNVVGRKQRELDKVRDAKDYKGPRTAAEFYGIWSLSGYRGQQKIRVHTNFDNAYYVNPGSSNNVFLYRYSQAYTESVLGKTNQMFKLYNWNVRHFTEKLEAEYASNFTNEFHPDSLCMQHLISPVIDRIQKRAERLYIADK